MAEKNETSWELSAYMDGELGEADAERVARALHDDAALRRELAALQATRELLGRLGRYRGGRELTGRILAAAEQLQARGGIPAPATGRAWWAKRFAAAAVLLAAAGVGVFVTANRFGPDDRPPGTPLARTDTLHGDGAGRADASRSGKDGTAVRAGDDVDKEVIFTHDLGAARRDVERALHVNGLADEAKAKPAGLAKGWAARDGGGNFRFNKLNAETVSYDVVGTAEQVMRLRTELRHIRASQCVVQSPGGASAGAADKLLTKAAKKTDAPAGGGFKGKAGPRPRAPLPKRAVRRGKGDGESEFGQDQKQTIVQTQAGRGQDVALKDLDSLLDMALGVRPRHDAAAPAAVQQAEQAQDNRVAQRGLKSGGGAASRPRPEREAPGQQGRESQTDQAVTANVRRLVITLNKSRMTSSSAARKAAMERAAEVTKE